MKDFTGRFVTYSSEPFKCPDKDCNPTGQEKVKLLISCPACPAAGINTVWHDFESAKGHFRYYQDEEIHQKVDPFREISIAQLNKILETTVKKDEVSKGISFLSMLNAQTESEQTNIMFSASSSTGKSYIPGELVQYFPSEDIIEYAGASPTSFFHEKGKDVIETENAYVPLETFVEPIETGIANLQAQEKPDRKTIKELEHKISELRNSAKKLVDLENKIVVFLDQPNTMLLQKLRSFLSHDKKTLEIPITDKAGHGGNRTKHVLLRGYTTVIFCTVSSDFDEQEGNRNFILSPGSEKSKIDEGLILLNKKLSNKAEFYNSLESNWDRQSLIFRIEMIRASGITKFVTDQKGILEQFLELHPAENPRSFRDFVRIFSLCYGHALLNAFNREIVNEGTIKANQTDIDAAFDLYEPIRKANESGISPECYDFLNEVVNPALEARRAEIEDSKKEDLPYGLSNRELTVAYKSKYNRVLAFEKQKTYLNVLVNTGFLSETKDPKDGRRALFEGINNDDHKPTIQQTFGA